MVVVVVLAAVAAWMAGMTRPFRTAVLTVIRRPWANKTQTPPFVALVGSEFCLHQVLHAAVDQPLGDIVGPCFEEGSLVLVDLDPFPGQLVD